MTTKKMKAELEKVGVKFIHQKPYQKEVEVDGEMVPLRFTNGSGITAILVKNSDARWCQFGSYSKANEESEMRVTYKIFVMEARLTEEEMKAELKERDVLFITLSADQKEVVIDRQIVLLPGRHDSRFTWPDGVIAVFFKGAAGVWNFYNYTHDVRGVYKIFG